MNQPVSKEELEYMAVLFSQHMRREQESNGSAYEVRNTGKLESSLAQPFQEISGQELYPSLIKKASMLYYFCIKNHPFEDGNKRMGIFALMIYLAKNNYWLDTSDEKLFNMTVNTAASKMEEKDEVVRSIEEFISDNIVKY